MSWAVGYDTKWQRDIGYGVPSICDFPSCNRIIDRGLAYVCCGEEPYGGDGCGLYFCDKHAKWTLRGRWHACSRCANYLQPFKPKPDLQSWINHKMTDESWSGWRKANLS